MYLDSIDPGSNPKFAKLIYCTPGISNWRYTARSVFYAAFKSSWDVRIYELTSRYYDVGCVQATLVRTIWRFNFSK